MAEQNETRRPTPVHAPDAPADRTPRHPADDVSIFSAPGLEVVMQWWAESNQRWSERRANTVAGG